MLNKNLFFLFVLFALSSCVSYQSFDLEVLIPAKHSFRPEIKSIVLVDNSNPYRGENVHKVKTLRNKTIIIDTIWLDDFSSIALKALKEELEFRNFFDSIYIHHNNNKDINSLKKWELSWQKVNDLCKKYNADAVIAFEKNKYATYINVEKVYDGILYGYLNASGTILWIGYDNEKKTHIYKEVQRDTISWSGEGVNIEQIAGELPPIKESLAELANYLGVSAATHAAPYWEKQKRGYYQSGNYQFLQASEFVRKEEWGEAIKLWKYVFDHSTKKTKARSAYNLAVASEILGDYESATYWLKKGLEELSKLNSQSAILDKTRLIEYSRYMDSRSKAVENLKIQVGEIK